jgi:hypothetical protein
LYEPPGAKLYDGPPGAELYEGPPGDSNLGLG